MSKILKNNTASPVLITDVGQTVPASGQLTIDPADYTLYAESSDVITFVGNSTLTVNDGSVDLTIADGSKLLQGLFPTSISLRDVGGNPVTVTGGSIDVNVNKEGLDPSADPNAALPVQLTGVQDMTNRIKVAAANRIVETNWQYTKQPDRWSERLTGGATISNGGQTDPAYLKAQCTTATGDKVEFQTKRYLIYSPFRTHIITMSCILGPGDPNVSKKFGQFTQFNGWYFEQQGSNFYICLRNNTFLANPNTELTRIERASWNIDRFDGTGPSGLTISSDFRNDLTFVIEFVWHGTQGIKYGIQYFDRTYWCHFIKHSDQDLKPFSRSALLPLRYEMENVGVPSTAPLWYIGPNSFNIEGGEERTGFSQGISSGVAGAALTQNSGETLLLAVRPKLQLNGINNRGSIIPKDFEVTATDTMLYRVYDQAVFGNGTWTSVGPDSIAEYSTDATRLAVTGNNYRIKVGYITAGSNKGSAITETFEESIAAFVDVLNNNAQTGFYITGERLGNNLTTYTAFNWKEVY